MPDLIYIPIAFLIIAIFYISNKELKKSREQSEISERELAKVREILDKVEEKSAKKMREERLQKIRELVKAAEFGRISQGLFHDLMTPLTGIMLQSEKSGGTVSPQKMAEYIGDIGSILSHEETQRKCFLKKELETVLHLLSYKIRENRCKVTILGGEETTWLGSPAKIRQVFLNLVLNAIDAGAKNVKILFKEENYKIILIVEDDGQGIKKEDMGKIFEAFFTTKSPEKGVGIGLATVKTIVEKDMQGSISVESEEGKGAVFKMIFPKR